MKRSIKQMLCGIVINKVDGSFDCSYKYENLELLEGSPKYVNGDVVFVNNELVDLYGSPERVEGVFYCGQNNLKTLEGGPKYVGKNFSCQHNELVDLYGSPEYVGGNFRCDNNNLMTLKGAPKEVMGDFVCWSNAMTFKDYEVNHISKVHGYIQTN